MPPTSFTEAPQEATNQQVELVFVDQGYTSEVAEDAALAQGIQPHVVKLEESKLGFAIWPRRCVAKRTVAWKTRFRRLVKDYERIPDMPAGVNLVAFACVMLPQAGTFLVQARPYCALSQYLIEWAPRDGKCNPNRHFW